MTLLLSVLFSFSSLFATDLICDLTSKPGSSTLKIYYNDDTDLPEAFFLRSPNEENFRKLDVIVDPVFPIDENFRESILVKPVEKEINWSKEPECYKEIGTQWYFEFQHLKEIHFVSFTPYFAKETESCYTPRFKPQKHRLSCKYK